MASSDAPSSVELSPSAAIRSTLPVQGAITKRSAQSVSDIWGIRHPCSGDMKSRSRHTRRLLSVESTIGLTKASADSVRIVSTSQPIFTQPCSRSGAL